MPEGQSFFGTIQESDVFQKTFQLGRPIHYDFAPARVGDQPIYVSDISRVTAELGWAPRRTTEEGVRELCGWVVSNAELLRSVLEQAGQP